MSVKSEKKRILKNKLRRLGIKIIEDFECSSPNTKIHVEDSYKYRYYMTIGKILAGTSDVMNLPTIHPENIYSMYNMDLWMKRNGSKSRIISDTKYVNPQSNNIFVECENGHRFETSYILIKIAVISGISGCPFCSQ